MRTKLGIAALLAAMALGGCGGGGDPADPALVQTGDGALRGSVVEGQRSFLGIPYAAAPTGAFRFRSPQPAPAWSGERLATALGSPCAQPVRDARGQPAVLGQEDCLTLNVYGPAQASALPVVVFLHGGASRNGAGGDVDPTRFSRLGRVLVVTLNFRLGVFGHLAHPALSAEDAEAVSGQRALQDQRLALQWVQRHIAAFGGHPGRVTLMGASSGGAAVCNHLATPASAGLFHRAIVQSSACTSTSSSVPLAQAEAAGLAFAAQVQCTTTDCLRAAPAASLVLAPATLRVGANPGWASAVGGSTLPVSAGEALRSGRFTRVPVLLGSNRHEQRLFVALQELAQGGPVSTAQYEATLAASFGPRATQVLATYPVAELGAANLTQAAVFTDLAYACPTERSAALFAAAVPTWQYEFDDPSAPTQVPAAHLQQGAYHAAELPYLFHQPLSAFGFGPIAALDGGQQALADRMVSHWAAFAASGDPNTTGASPWPRRSATSSTVRRLAQGGPDTTTDFATLHRCDFWAGFGA